MPTDDVELLSGYTVKIAHTDELQPTQHGEGYDNQWKQTKGRTGLSFYDSTVDYMRNEWVEIPGNMRSVEGTLEDKKLLLFFDERTRTWNSAEALDVDHKQPWLEHFHELEGWSKSDAMLCYNDVDNLRMVSATYNRARTSADKILDEHGAESPEWRDWVQKKMRFDADKDYPAYDVATDGTTRNRKTTEAEWTQGVDREGLNFDPGIKKVWFQHALKEAYAGDVTIPDPDHPDDRSRDHSVQLFRCGATDQYVTMGGIDIDHKITFAEKLGDMLEQNRLQREQAELLGLDPVPPITRAQVMDLYNDPDNLRLMSRSANSSHEWEVGQDGQLYDPVFDDYEYATEEPKPVVEDDEEAPIQYEDDAPQVNLKKRGRDDDLAPKPSLDDDNAPEPVTKRDKATGDPLAIDPREAALLNLQGRDFDMYQKIVGDIGKLDPAETGPLTEKQRENLAMSLVSFARQGGLNQVDHVVTFNETGRHPILFAVQGPLDQDTGKAWIPIDRFKHQPMEVTARLLADHPSPIKEEPQHLRTTNPQHL